MQCLSLGRSASFRAVDECDHVAIKLLTTIAGLIELNGRLPGRIKFAGDGGSPKALVILGELKSSISSLNIIPVDLERIIAPNLLNKDACKEAQRRALYRWITDRFLRAAESFRF